jgi:nucleoside transporter
MSPKLHFQLSLLFFLQFFLWGSWYVTLGTYLIEKLGFSGTEIGLIYGATAIAATISPFFLGVVADRLYNAEQIMSILHFCGGIVMWALSYIESFAWFYPLLIVYALLYIPTFALSTALAFHHLERATRDFPRVRVWGTVGWVVSGFIISALDWENAAYPMQMAAASSILLSLFCRYLPATPPQAASGKLSLKKIIGPEVLALFKKRPFTILMASLVLIAIPSGFYYSFVNPFLVEIGMQNAAGKMALGQVSEVLIMLFMPFLFTRFSLRWIIAIGLFAWGGRYLLFAFGDIGALSWMLYAAILLHGVAFNFSALAVQIYIDKIVPVHVRSTAQGFIAQMTLGLGALIGAFIAGQTVSLYTIPDEGHAWTNIWLVPAAIGIVVTLFFVVFFREKK